MCFQIFRRPGGTSPFINTLEPPRRVSISIRALIFFFYGFELKWVLAPLLRLDRQLARMLAPVAVN